MLPFFKKKLADKNNIFLLLLLLTPFIYIDGLFDKVGLPRFAYVAIIATTWLLTWFIQLNKNNASISWNPLYLLVIFLLFIASISYLWGSGNMLYQAELIFYISIAITCFLAMQVASNTVIKYIPAVAIISAVCAIIGILQHFDFNPFNFQQISKPASTFINKNFASNYFDLIFPLTIALFFISKNTKEAWISAICISIIFSYLILTKSRGAYLSTLITLAIFFISIQIFPFARKQITNISSQYKKQIALILLIPIILFILPGSDQDTSYQTQSYANFFSKQKQNSISLRLNAYENSFSLIKENPLLGVGLGGFQNNFRLYTQSTFAKNKIFSDFMHLHNEPLQLIVELGIIGGITLFIFFAFLLKFSITILKHKNPTIFSPGGASSIDTDSQKIVYLGFIIAILSSLSHSLVSFPYHQPTSAVFMALWVGFILKLSSKQIFVPITNSLKKLMALLVIPMIIYLLVISNFYFQYIKSSMYMEQSSYASNCDEAAKLATLSNKIYPKDYLSQSQAIQIVASCSKNTDEKLSIAENVLKYNPTHPWALYLASQSYFKLGQYKSSYNLLKSLTFLYPYFSSAYTLIGHIAIKEKNYANARSYYKHALKLDPNNKEAANLLHKLDKKGY